MLNYLGYTMVEKRVNLDEALGMIERAVAARPDSGYIVDSLGWVLYRLGRYDEAIGHMERAAELMPTDPVVNDHLGDVLWAVDRKTEARFQWRRALSLHKTTPSPDLAIRTGCGASWRPGSTRCWPRKAPSRFGWSMTAGDLAVEEPAPAKINLTLHVTGRRADGYHLLDSLVVFADAGDSVCAERADSVSLTVTGPMAAGVPTGAENACCGPPRSSGDGGDHARQAPAIRGRDRRRIERRGGVPAGAGAAGRPTRARGAGPRRGCAGVPAGASGADARDRRGCGAGRRPAGARRGAGQPARAGGDTGGVRAAGAARQSAMPGALPRWRDAAECAGWLATQRNDLEAPARAICPEIGAVLDSFRGAEGCALARMSGSGATCFGLYPDPGAARRAAARIATQRPDWWVVATRLR